ncbi:MAG: TIGR00730 family Rossman fold protein [Candidatus Sumerlaeota bacterium]
MPNRRTICVFCASSDRVDRAYMYLAEEMGREAAARGHGLVYGGGKVGLMGVMADAALAEGGEVIGVIPEALRDLELAHEGASEMIVTRDMHERKATMARRSDAFIALPGGFGTFEEITEVMAHRQLELHTKPCVILNAVGYYDPLLEQFERAFSHGFASERYRSNYHVAGSVPEALDFIESFAV